MHLIRFVIAGQHIHHEIDAEAPRHFALLGAAALGDIGRHFPPGEERWRGADSRELLAAVVRLLDEAGWRAENTDLTIVCEQPRIGPHVGAMREIIAGVLGLDTSAVSVKATTTEKLGFCGRGEGIAALAVALVSAAT